MYAYQNIVEPTKVFYLCNFELKFTSWKNMDGLNSKFRRSKSEQLVRLQIKMDRQLSSEVDDVR
jgi:hypothetical protein